MAINQAKLQESLAHVLTAGISPEITVEAHDANAGAGTKQTGYALPEMGPFRCDNCLHYHGAEDTGHCNHPEVIADPDVPQEDGKAVVHGQSCCNEFHPLDKGEAEK